MSGGDTLASSVSASASASALAKVAGMDVEEDDKKEDEDELRPLMLVGKRADGTEEEVALLGPDLIRQSAVLTGTRWSDKTTDRIVVDILPPLLQLLVRFGKLVTHHNQLANASNNNASSISNNNASSNNKSGSSTAQVGANLIPLPIKSLPPQFNFQNRAMHLPYIIGFSPVLAEFLNIVAERPYTGLQCAQAAERLLWEPAQTAFLYKFGTFCKGFSHPFIELIWPNNYTLTNNHNNKSSSESSSSSSSSLSSSLTKNKGGGEVEVVVFEEMRWLETVVRLTGKFFEPARVTNKNLLPPTPLATGASSSRRVQNKRKLATRNNRHISTSSQTYTPPPPPNLVVFKPPATSPSPLPSFQDAVSALEQWIDDSIDLH